MKAVKIFVRAISKLLFCAYLTQIKTGLRLFLYNVSYRLIVIILYKTFFNCLNRSLSSVINYKFLYDVADMGF